ncbi:hypothetical protein [Arthrobacter sp. NPDC056727]|uniref:hypothetical protein n=1 Tax=Arthrobacter sp. NPDC056727 TaxID=3345927 RepID=UPI0036734F45
MNAGVLLAGEGVAADMSEASVVHISGEIPVVTDGPYRETYELFNGSGSSRPPARKPTAVGNSTSPDAMADS